MDNRDCLQWVDLKCVHCGKTFRRTVPKNDPDKYKDKSCYCSKSCSGKGRRNGSYLPCRVCGKEVYKTPSQLKRVRDEEVYCSSSCATTFFNLNHRRGENAPRYINGSQSYRTIALDNYPPECECCGFDETEIILDVHHIDENRGHNWPENLIIQCPNCHAKLSRKVNVLIGRKHYRSFSIEPIIKYKERGGVQHWEEHKSKESPPQNLQKPCLRLKASRSA